jgi:UDP-2,3-diacylglucosamine pyrophosphatase LpxH
MLVVLSDIHFQDTATSGPGAFGDANVRPGAFEQLWRQLDLLAEGVEASMPITVVLNGDVIELLRSERWLVEGTRPYNFTGAPDAATLRTAAGIGEAILRENERAIRALGSRKARFVVVYGNHDRLLREDALAPVRAGFAKLLGGDVQFVDIHRDERHRAVIHHGHELDWTCSEYQHARVFEGWNATNPAHRMLAPLGDWIALDM